jgi:hypothetical protein
LEVNKTLFIATVLREIAGMGYHLQATVPMAKRLLGFARRKEIWVFKGKIPQ